MDGLAELEALPLGLPEGLELEWLGVAGYRLTYEGTSILVDPYVSRVPLRSVLLRRPALPDDGVIDRYVKPPGPVAGILVGHTHWDHAVDAPALARRFDAPAFGSESLAQLMRLHGRASTVVEPRKRYELGPFVVSFTPSRHSKLLFGRKVPFAGPLTCEDVHALTPGAYKCGAVYGIRIEVAGIALYHQGSADLDDDALGHEPVDVFLAGVTGRQVTPRYWERILPKLDPRVLVPTHYDDFFAPLGTRLKLIRKVNLEGVPDEVRAVTQDATVAALRRVD
ncbi:MBL fold metallo-hydrolase [Solirubrobacter phytolaccae]|uniref:MBL fold metallo-hydrolase n=1 Tax=Solirubrobacter phytolaccae TaxID=1404360 RepID=A0A9X3SDC8_9ACTN|nr:MBL fold metallo-hydrolase [Solirubrobacter phytolaccae]MDA0179597.1 MBL fold metallo-hydrolase [Solirubrobacter phytolaccae]